MALIRKSAPPAVADADAFVGNRGQGRRRSSLTNAAMERATLVVGEIVREERPWSAATPIHFLALYCYMHLRVYKVAPVLSESDRKRAVFLVAALLRQPDFGGDPEKFAEFMRWAWRREAGKERWCREQRIERRTTMGWRLCFSASMLTEYRVDQKREEGRGAR